VRLDAIFIDEGFGSLDSADDAGTLDQVLQSLTELVGKRRAVGNSLGIYLHQTRRTFIIPKNWIFFGGGCRNDRL